MTKIKLSTTAAIARLNDRFRHFPGSGWVITEGVRAKGNDFAVSAI